MTNILENFPLHGRLSQSISNTPSCHWAFLPSPRRFSGPGMQSARVTAMADEACASSSQTSHR